METLDDIRINFYTFKEDSIHLFFMSCCDEVEIIKLLLIF